MKAAQHELAISAEGSGNLLFFPDTQEELSATDVTEVRILTVRPLHDA